MKAHYDTWWAFVHEGRLGKDYKSAMLKVHSNDFIRVSEDAHYNSTFVYLAHLFDKRSDVSSIPVYLSLIKSEIEDAEYLDLQNQYGNLKNRATPILKIRHKLVAHIDSQLSEADIFDEIGMTWNAVRDVLYDTAKFVATLNQSSVTPRDGRLSEAVQYVLKRLA